MTTPANAIIRKNIFFLLALIPPILFGIYIYYYAVNVPYMDDAGLIETINATEADKKSVFSQLLSQQNDHRILFSRLGILFTYGLAHTLDFRLTILLGYLNLVLLGYCFYLVHQSVTKEKESFLAASILLFSPIVYQLHLWSIAAFQYTLSIAFSILCLFFLQPCKRKYWWISCVFAVSASLTNLDGISVLPVALFWLATQARWKHLLVYLAFSVLYLTLFFTDFKFSSASKLDFTFSSIPLLLKNIITITGSIAKIISDTHAVMLSFTCGLIIILTFIIFKIFPGLTIRQPRFSPQKLFDLDFVDLCCLRLFAGMAMIAIGRFSDGVEAMVAIRFQIYSVSIAIIFYLFLLKSFRNKAYRWFHLGVLSLSVIASGYSYAKYDTSVKYFVEGLKADSYNYPHNQLFLHQYFNLPDPDPLFYRYYKFPVYFPEKTISAWKNNLQDLRNPKLTHFSELEIPVGSVKGDLYSKIQIEINNHEPDAPSKEIYLGLISHGVQTKCYILAIRKLQNGNYQANMPKKIPPGPYTLMMCWVEKGMPVSRKLSEKIML